ncbi:MAG: hypothetical protein Q8896_09630, partial [Bacteroidota bacterium]|nr:hypothetical protein [Bacteroidota bacterium]
MADPLGQQKKRITYIITVHGMGEQRNNETLTPVVSRLVDVIRDRDGKDKNPYPRNTLSLGQATGQETEAEPWAAFDELTIKKLQDGEKGFCFYGLKAAPHTDPDCIRFSDIYWQDVLQQQCESVGQPTDTWIGAVVSRVFQNPAQPARLKSLLYTLEQTVDILYYASKFKFPEISSTAFGKYLGDVQVYTESDECRAQAIAKFQSRIKVLDEATLPDYEARFIVIAHSLGTIMTLDALIDAAGKDLPWVDRIDALITLGSPIDKIITLWDYEYKDELGAIKIPRAKKIPLYNYSDEQDPVGYYLIEVSTKDSFYNLFEKKEDIVYNHCVVPGLAHVSYWDDIELFRHITKTVIAPAVEQVKDAKMWFKKAVYAGVLGITYFLIPLLISIANVVTLSLALDADSWQARIINSFLFVVTLWFGKQIISLTINWRLSANRGRRAKPISPDPSIDGNYKYKWMNLLLWSIMIVTTILPAYFFICPPWENHLTLSVKNLLPLAITIVLSVLALFIYFRQQRRRQAIMKGFMSNDIATALTVLFAAGLFTGAALTKHISVVGFSGSDTLQVFGQGIPKARSLYDLLPSASISHAQGNTILKVPPVSKRSSRSDTKSTVQQEKNPPHSSDPGVRTNNMQNQTPPPPGSDTTTTLSASVRPPSATNDTKTQTTPAPMPASSPVAAGIKPDTVYVVKAASPAQEDSQKSAILYYSALMSAFT